jgi:pimeloyl-ACP methyl ester carboxylesterase
MISSLPFTTNTFPPHCQIRGATARSFGAPCLSFHITSESNMSSVLRRTHRPAALRRGRKKANRSRFSGYISQRIGGARTGDLETVEVIRAPRCPSAPLTSAYLITIGPGRLEQPFGFLGLRFVRERPEDHFFIEARVDLSEDELLREFSGSALHTALLFIHGYQSTFDDAMKVAAQIAHDVRFKGPVLAFSWPSRGSLLPYMADEATVDVAIAHCQVALSLIEAAGITRVVALAHSMGGRILSEVLHHRHLSRTEGTLQAAVFAAPDVDRDAFRQNAASYMATAKGVTLYGSRNDWAMTISRTLHAEPRAGDANPILICSGVDSIDASAARIGFPPDIITLGKSPSFCKTWRLCSTVNLCPGGYDG